MPKRTVKSCGLDASTPALTGDDALHHAGMVTRKPDHQREHEGNRKTVAQGMPDRFGEPVVVNSCAFYFAREAAGAPDTRHSLRPLHEEGCRSVKLGCDWRRENAALRPEKGSKRWRRMERTGPTDHMNPRRCRIDQSAAKHAFGRTPFFHAIDDASQLQFDACALAGYRERDHRCHEAVMGTNESNGLIVRSSPQIRLKIIQSGSLTASCGSAGARPHPAPLQF
jgi:hypothetical protein